MKTEQLDKFFNEYEKNFRELNIESFITMYADSFISAGPKGAIVERKEDFQKKAGQARDFYKSIGQHSGRLLSKKITPISNEYSMVTVHWGVMFEKTGDRVMEFDVSYIVEHTGDKPKVILFISHEDEEETMKELGLQTQIAESA